MAKLTANLVDAQAMARAHPNTFDAPAQGELFQIMPGDFVKVCRNNERFWIEVTGRNGDMIVGAVANALVFNRLKTVTRRLRHVFAVRREAA
jgi:hypothetical protein